MRACFPFAYRWLAELDDASGVEGAWRDPAVPLPPIVTGLLKMAGSVYFPFLLANARAVQDGAPTFSVTLEGKAFSQGAFKYQVRCLADLRAAYANLDGVAKAAVDPVLADAGCLTPLKG
jgi:hypothetical protein